MKTELHKEKSESTKAIIIALTANVLISIIKLFGYFISKSPSMLAESLHSIADSFNQLLLFFGIRYANIIPTKEHPWGTGSKQYLFNLFSAIGVFIVGFCLTIYNAINELIAPKPFSEKGLSLSILILVISLLIEGYSFKKAVNAVILKMKRSGRNFYEYLKTTDDSSLLAILLEDGVAVFGVIIALIGLGLSKYYDSSVPDAISAIIIGSILGMISVFLFKNNLAFILGKSTDEKKQQEIKEYLTSFKSVDHVVDLKTEVLGPNRIHLIAELDINNSSLIDKRQIKKDAELIKKDPSKIYEVLIDTWMRGGRIIARELSDIDHKLKTKFREIEITHFEVIGGEHIEIFEVLKNVEVYVNNPKDLVHVGMIKVKGKITKEKILKSLIDENFIEELNDYVVNFEENNEEIDIYLKNELLIQLRK